MNTHGMNWIRQERRLAIYIRDGFTCVYCTRDLRDVAPGELTLDHLMPRERGGGNESTNLVTACRACNSSKHDRTLEEYIASLSESDHTIRLRIEYTSAQFVNVPLARSILFDRVQ